MNISNHINLIKKYGYRGKIGIVKQDVSMSAKKGDVVLFKLYEVRDQDDESGRKYNKNHCTIEKPYSEEEIQKRIKEGNGIKTFCTCVGVPLSIIDEIIIE